MALATHPEVEGNAPSVRELAALVGLSMATIWRYLDLLRARRLVGLGRCTL
jgi:DNA-binding IclR family transcriptional regulator